MDHGVSFIFAPCPLNPPFATCHMLPFIFENFFLNQMLFLVRLSSFLISAGEARANTLIVWKRKRHAILLLVIHFCWGFSTLHDLPSLLFMIFLHSSSSVLPRYVINKIEYPMFFQFNSSSIIIQLSNRKIA